MGAVFFRFDNRILRCGKLKSVGARHDRVTMTSPSPNARDMTLVSSVEDKIFEKEFVRCGRAERHECCQLLIARRCSRSGCVTGGSDGESCYAGKMCLEMLRQLLGKTLA